MRLENLSGLGPSAWRRWRNAALFLETLLDALPTGYINALNPTPIAQLTDEAPTAWKASCWRRRAGIFMAANRRSGPRWGMLQAFCT